MLMYSSDMNDTEPDKIYLCDLRQGKGMRFSGVVGCYIGMSRGECIYKCI